MRMGRGDLRWIRKDISISKEERKRDIAISREERKWVLYFSRKREFVTRKMKRQIRIFTQN